MASHEAHERTHGVGEPGPDPILYDDCSRCAEHAANVLWSLDAEHTAALWRWMIEVEKTGGPHYRSENEARACRTLREVALFLERNTGIDPWRWPLR